MLRQPLLQCQQHCLLCMQRLPHSRPWLLLPLQADHLCLPLPPLQLLQQHPPQQQPQLLVLQLLRPLLPMRCRISAIL